MFSLVILACFDQSATETPTPVAATTPATEAAAPAAVTHIPASPAVPVSVEEFPADDPAEGFARVTVRHGETLDGLARLAGTRPETLAALNHRSVTAPLVPGEEIVVPEADTFDERRESHLDERLFRFFEVRGGMVGVSSRVVATGDTAWGIAKEEGVPLWVVAGLNRGRSLDRLSVGDELYLPLLGDTLQYPPEEGLSVADEATTAPTPE